MNRRDAFEVASYQSSSRSDGEHHAFILDIAGHKHTIGASASGPIDAFMVALACEAGLACGLDSYSEHALGQGRDARAVAYVKLDDGSGRHSHGVGVHANIVTASLYAIASALHRAGALPRPIARAAE